MPDITGLGIFFFFVLYIAYKIILALIYSENCDCDCDCDLGDIEDLLEEIRNSQDEMNEKLDEVFEILENK